MDIGCHQRPLAKSQIILQFSQYSDRDLVLSNAYKLAGARRTLLADWPVQMKEDDCQNLHFRYVKMKNFK